MDNKLLNEGALIDNIIALRLLWIFITPFDKTDAFKFGIIDKDGKPLKKASALKTSAEKDSYSMLHRLAFRLKRVLGVLPFGKTNLASYGAAYMLVRENLANQIEPDSLEELFVSVLNNPESSLMIESIQEEFINALQESDVLPYALELKALPTDDKLAFVNTLNGKYGDDFSRLVVKLANMLSGEDDEYMNEDIGNVSAGIEGGTPRIKMGTTSKDINPPKKIKFKKASLTAYNSLPKLENTLYLLDDGRLILH